MISTAVIFLVGLLLSAFFSGCETGFYRATRVRWQLDAMSGDRMTGALIWLANNPSMFVATTLVGNNLANYLTSFAMVLAAVILWPAHQDLLGTVAPITLSPVVFVYGELLPKNLFFHAPNRLLRLAAPVFLVFSLLFLPASLVLWILARVLRFLAGEAPERLQLSLARQELQRVFDEGHDVGLLRPVQRQLAQGMLALVDSPLRSHCVPVTRPVAVRLQTPVVEVLRIASRNRSAYLMVTEAKGRRILGYVRVADLQQQTSQTLTKFRDLMEISATESPVTALVLMQEADEPWLRVVDDTGRPDGLLQADRLLDVFLRESGSPG